MVADQNRLKYAFGKKRQIQKKQKDLKKLQHMFLFLTTCYIYNSSQKSGLEQPDINSLQGTVQNVPVQISMPNSNGRGSTLLYEATLTLKPTSSSGNNRTNSRPTDGESKVGKHSLDNMRRSPYFCDSFLQPSQSKADYARYQIEEPDDEGRFDVLSREEASRDVDKLLLRVRRTPLSSQVSANHHQQWFQNSSPGPASPRPSARRPVAPIPRAPEPPSNPPGHFHESEEEDFDHIHAPYLEEDSFLPLRHTVSPRGDRPPQSYPLRPAGTRPSAGPRMGSTTSNNSYSGGAERGRGGLKGRGRRRSWDWTCDGCDGKVSYLKFFIQSSPVSIPARKADKALVYLRRRQQTIPMYALQRPLRFLRGLFGSWGSYACTQGFC